MRSLSVISQGQPATALEALLAAAVPSDAGVEFKVRRFRSLDPTVLVAIVGAGGGAFGALIAGALKVAEKKGATSVVLSGSKGRRIEVPANTAPEKIAEYVRLAIELDADRLDL